VGHGGAAGGGTCVEGQAGRGRLVVEMQRGDGVEEQSVLARGTAWRSNRWRLGQRGQCGGVEDGRHGLRGFSGRRWWHRGDVED
jgi:hypothetical protein